MKLFSFFKKKKDPEKAPCDKCPSKEKCLNINKTKAMIKSQPLFYKPK